MKTFTDISQPLEAEDRLVEMAQHGDRNAFGRLIRTYYPGVIRISYHMCGDAGQAEDAAQEAFLRAWLNLPSFRIGMSLRNWLYRIAVNVTVDLYRRKKDEHLEAIVIDGLWDTSVSPESAMIEKEQAAQLEKGLNSLPEAARSVLVLREFSGLSYQEIANVLGIPIGTVMSRLNYARSRLRELVQEEWIKSENEYA